MKPLKKSEKARFDSTCREIRTALKIDHWRTSYNFCKENDGDAAARYHVYDNGQYVCITIFPAFWCDDAEWQLRALVHEHVHAVLSPLTQTYNSFVDLVHPSDRPGFVRAFGHADEQVTCHLEGIVFDLLKDRL